MGRNVFYDLRPEPIQGFYRFRGWGELSMGREPVTEEQHTALAVELATIKAMLGMNTQCIRRVEIRLLGSNEDPESGIIALMARKSAQENDKLRDELNRVTTRLRSLEDDRLRFWAVGGAILFVLKVFERPILAFFGIH